MTKMIEAASKDREAAIARINEDHEREKKRLLADTADTIKRERDGEQERLERRYAEQTKLLLQHHDQQLQQQRERLYGEMDKDRDKYQQQQQAQQAAHHKQLEEMEKRHQQLMKQEADNHSMELSRFKQQISADTEQQLRQKEQQLKSCLLRDRDAELDMVIQRLGEETVKMSEEERKQSDRRVRDVQALLEAERQSKEGLDRTWKHKFDTQSKRANDGNQKIKGSNNK
jgi:hypothetical protein